MKTILKRNLPFYLPLTFQIFPLYYLMVGNYAIWSWLCFLLFNSAYFYLIHSSKRVAWRDNLALVIMMAYIGLASLLWYPAMFMNMFYVTNILVWIMRERLSSRRFQLFLLASLLIFVGILMGSYSLEVKVTIVAVSVFAFGFTFYLAGMIEKEAQEKERLQHHESINLLMAENERNRIGQDLHDSLGHVFATMSVKTELVKTLLENGMIDAAQKEVSELHHLTQSSMKEVRTIVENLKSHRLEEELKIVENLLALADVQLEVEGIDIIASLSPSQSSSMAMVLRELTNNLLKHSRAKRCKLSFSGQAGHFYLIYEDDGLGFNQITGQELHSIRERMLRQGGVVTIRSQVQPTMIEVELPLEEL